MYIGKLRLMYGYQHGSPIARTTSSNVDEFEAYLLGMVHRYWNTSLHGCNLAILEPEILHVNYFCNLYCIIIDYHNKASTRIKIIYSHINY